MVSRRGSSLVELVVALLLLEVAGAAALAAALTADRLGRRAQAGSATDASRWARYRETESSSGCRGAATPTATLLMLPAAPDRDSLQVVVRCGR
ncbi:MAG: hypothetical protein ABIZ70_08955 [Gemmatimonadales bacterium]